MSSPPPPECHATMCGEVTCVGHGCVSIPIIVLLLCCCAFYGRRRRDLQRIERLERAQAGIIASRDHYYYASQAGCNAQQPGYMFQQPGCVAQHVVPGCIVQQPNVVVQGAVMGSQPTVVTAQPVTSVAQAPQLAAGGEEEVPMGLPVS